MEMVVHELNRLVDDYYKCPNSVIKEQILRDIKLLRDALLINDIEYDLKIPLDFV